MDRKTAHSEPSRRLKERLRHELRWLRLRLVGHAALMLLGGVGLLFGVAVATAPGWTGFGPAGAWAVWGVAAVATVLVLVFELLRPLRRIANLKGFTRELERHASYGNLLEAATQFSSPRRSDPIALGASPDLVQEIMRRASEAAEASRLAPRVPLAGIAPNVAASVAALLLWAFLGGFAADRIRETAEVLGDPQRLADVVPRSGLYAVDGDRRVAVGGELAFTVHDFAAGDETIVLEINRSGDFWQEELTQSLPPAADPASFRAATATVKRIEDPFRYRFRKGTITSRVHRVEVRERPILTELRLIVQPPAYSGIPRSVIDNPGGAITVLEGTEIGIEGRANGPLTAARRVEEQQSSALDVDGDAFRGSFVVAEDLRFRIELTDLEELTSEARSEYQILARQDEPPTVKITAPAQDLPLERDLQLRIAGIAADDVGLARLDLVYRSESRTDWIRRPLFVADGGAPQAAGIGELQLDRGELDVAVNFVWDLGDLQLLPGDAVLYALEATDNNALAGGQVTRSQVWSLRLPTIAEVFDVDREERSENSGQMRELLAEGEQLKSQLERLERELKKNPNPDWEKQQEIRDTLEKQQALREKMQEALGEMQQQLEDFERNNAGSLELLQKMETIQELLQELRDDQSLQAYLDAMREAMNELQPHEIQRNMQDALNDQQEFNRRLDRTIELLKQLERERTMSDLVEEVNEYLRRQDQLAELTDPQTESEGEPEATPQTDDPREGEPEEESSEGENPESPREGETTDRQETGEPDQQAQEPSDDAASEQVSPSDEELARMQEQLREETERLEERIREALEQLKQEQEQGEAQNPSAKEMREALEKALEEMQEQRPSQPMRDAEEQLAEGERQQANQNQEEARKRLLSLYDVLLEGQQMMQQQQGKFAGEQLQKAAFDLLQLSHRQEEVIGSVADGMQGQRTQPIAREQGRIQRATQGVSEAMEALAREDFNIPERLLGELRRLAGMTDDAVQELQLGRARRSQQVTTEVMGNMNQVVISLLTAARSSQGGGGSGDMASPSQQMREMAQEQSRLNGMTQELRRRGEQGFSQEERRQLAELQSRQQAIREHLERVREQIDDERRVLGDLDQLGREIERVEDDLGTGELTENTERQQEKILSRLLDAERSIRERDFAKRRESRGAQDVYTRQEGESGLPDAQQREDALRRFVAPELAPEVYREDVRRYFRSIQRELELKREGGR